MSKLDEVISKLSSITPEVIDEGLLKVVKQNQSEAIDMNLAQLSFGKDSRGQTLGTYRNEIYASFKAYLNPSPGFRVMDWKLTGALYGAWYVSTDQFPITFGSSDEKFETLKQVNEEATGLDQTNLEQFRQDVKPQVQDLYRSFLQL